MGVFRDGVSPQTEKTPLAVLNLSPKRIPNVLTNFTNNTDTYQFRSENRKTKFFLNSNHGLRIVGPSLNETESLSPKIFPPGTNPEKEGIHLDPKQEPNKVTTEQAQIAHSILSTYSKTTITIYVPLKTLIIPTKKAFMKSMPALNKFEGRINFRVGGHVTDCWAQDLGESSLKKIGGGSIPYLLTGIPSRLGRHIPKTLDTKSARIPVVFDGGDVVTTSVKGKNLVVIGPDTIFKTKEYYKSKRGYSITDREIKAVFKKAFGADDVLILKSKSVPERAFHIDQAVFFPKDGVAVVGYPKLEGEEKWYRSSRLGNILRYSEAVKNYEKQLQAAGFKIVKIPARETNVSLFQAYTNAIPITGTDGKTTVIMPSFIRTEKEIRKMDRLDVETMSRKNPGAYYTLYMRYNKKYGKRMSFVPSEEEMGRITGLMVEENNKIKLNEQNIRQIMRDNGIKVKFIRNHSYNIRGNTHCMTGAVARLDERKLDLYSIPFRSVQA